MAVLVAGEGGERGAEGQRRELLKPSRKRVPFCWQTQARNVNWGQPEVSVFTGPAGFSRTACTHTERQYTYCIYTVNSKGLFAVYVLKIKLVKLGGRKSV